MLFDVGDRWSTTATAAGRSAGRWATSRRRLSTPPAEAPITTRLVLLTGDLLASSSALGIAGHRSEHKRAGPDGWIAAAAAG
jgi:hypothetical protein